MRPNKLAPVVVCALLLLAPVTPADGTGKALSLDEVLRTALENNLDLVSARRDPAIAENNIQRSRAPFDGTINSSLSYVDSEGQETITDRVSSTQGPGTSKFQQWDGSVSFEHLLGFGASYTLSFEPDDTESSRTSIEPTTGFLTDSVSMSKNDGFSLTYRMPLLRGFGTEANKVDVLLARGNYEISKEDLRLQAMQTLKSVEDAYWNVLASREALRISRLALERANDLLELNKKKVEVGTLAPIEITEAEAGVASQVEAVIVAETTLENDEDTLLQLLAIPEDDALWDQSLELVDRPSFVPADIDLGAAIDTALAERPEMFNARRRLRNDELSERVARNKLRHGLDLTATLSPNQNSENDRLVTPQGFAPSDTNTDGETDSWSVALNYSYPLRNRSAKAGYGIAKLNAEKSDVAVRSQEQKIRVEVRQAARNVESGIQRVAAARKSVELQEEKLDAERKKFDNGMSTSFEVLTFQKDLADAELAEIRARLDYLKSLTSFELSKGTLLESRNLAVGD